MCCALCRTLCVVRDVLSALVGCYRPCAVFVVQCCARPRSATHYCALSCSALLCCALSDACTVLCALFSSFLCCDGRYINLDEL